MSTKQVPYETVQALAQKFIDIANGMKEGGEEIEVINSALMLASGIYATYSTVGNDSYLKESGVEKVTEVFKRNLASLQQIEKNQLDQNSSGNG